MISNLAALMSSGKPKTFRYLGCFINENKRRISGHLRVPKSFSECREAAIKVDKAIFGLEYPKGAKVPGQSYSLTETLRH